MEKDPLAIQIGNNVRYFRKKSGMTQAQLAEAINVNPTFISRVERGEKSLGIKKLQAVAQVFRVSCDAVIRGPESEARIQNIRILLEDCPDAYVAWIENVVRTCTECPCGNMKVTM